MNTIHLHPFMCLFTYSKKGDNKIGKKVSNFIYYVLLVTITMSTLFIYLNKNNEDSVFSHYRWFTVLTNSMNSDRKDSFAQGDIIFVKKVPYESIKKGDIISYKMGGGSVLTHRVVSVQRDSKQEFVFITQGDINNTLDPPVEADRVIGKYQFHIPLLGRIIQFVKKFWYLMIPFIGSIYLLIKLYLVEKKGDRNDGKEKRNKKKKHSINQKTTQSIDKGKRKSIRSIKNKKKSHVKSTKEINSKRKTSKGQSKNKKQTRKSATKKSKPSTKSN